MIKAAIPDAQVTIRDLAGDGDHYAATVISESFRGKSRVQQHQIVYQSLKGQMGGVLHALALQTGVPEHGSAPRRGGQRDGAGEARGALLRERAARAPSASPMSNCSSTWCSFSRSRRSRTRCSAHFTPLGVLQTAILFLAVWWVWIFTSWITNWLDPEQTPVRVLLFG